MRRILFPVGVALLVSDISFILAQLVRALDFLPHAPAHETLQIVAATVFGETTGILVLASAVALVAGIVSYGGSRWQFRTLRACTILAFIIAIGVVYSALDPLGSTNTNFTTGKTQSVGPSGTVRLALGLSAFGAAALAVTAFVVGSMALSGRLDAAVTADLPASASLPD